MSVPVKLKRLPHGEGLPLPAYATAGAAGMDVVSAEDVVLAPHLAVEPLHAMFLAPARPRGELLARGEKAAVLAQHQRHPARLEQRARTIELVDHVLLAPLGGDHAGGAELLGQRRQPLGVRRRIAQHHPMARLLERRGEVAHGGQHQHQLLTMPRE